MMRLLSHSSTRIVRALALAAVTLALAACEASSARSITPQSAPTRIPTATFPATGIPATAPTPLPVYTRTPTIEPPPTRTPSLTPLPLPTETVSPTGAPISQLPSAACGGRAASANLLINGGLEGGQHEQESGDVRVPDGWAGFWKAPGTPVLYDPQNTSGYQRPEMSVIAGQPPFDNPSRIFEGAQALRVTGNERAFDAGVWQQVAVTPGAVYCVTGSGHAWSSHGSYNPFQSTLDTADDQRNANFLLGIDPTGGTDPWSGNIVWGSSAQLYDRYQPIYAARTSALTPTITVFVRGFMLWRFDHNEMFFDGIALNQLEP